MNPRKFGVLLEDPKGSFYLKDNNHAYHYDTRSHSPRITLLKDVESKNFEILDDIFSPEGFYLRDSKRMYHYLTHKNGKFTALSVLSGVDPNSLEVVWTSKYRAYWKDKKHVYYLSYRNPYDGKAEHVIDVLEGADPKTFRASIEGTMGAMDKNFYFFYNYKAKKIDKNTLQKYMEGQWKYEGKDQTRVFELDETVSLRGQILMDESCLTLACFGPINYLITELKDQRVALIDTGGQALYLVRPDDFVLPDDSSSFWTWLKSWFD